MRRAWLTVLVGILSLVVGLTIGFTVGLLQRSVNVTWLDTVGTWVSAGIAAAALILAFSAEFAGRRQHRREWRQREADLVRCDAQVGYSVAAVDPERLIVTKLVVKVDNRSSIDLTDLECRVHFRSSGEDQTFKLRNELNRGETCQIELLRDDFQPKELEIRKNSEELRENVEFIFLHQPRM